MRSTVKLLVVCLVFVSAAALGEPPKADPARLAIERAGKAFADAFGRGDIAAVAAMYAEDAIALPPDGGMLDVVDVVSSGNLAAETGVATLRVQPAGAGEAAVTVKYVVVWKKKGGTWQLYRDIWNNMPANAAPAASGTPTPPPHH